MGRDLPEFESPPLDEVFLSVQFDQIEDLRTPHIGLLWDDYRERFPKIEERSPIDPVFERFGVSSSLWPQVSFRAFDVPPLPRVWFISNAGNELVQIQSDRFIHNWRKIGTGDTYPRYEQIRETFKSELTVFKDFILDEGLGTLRPNQCEVNYINLIRTGDSGSARPKLDELIRVFRLDYSEPCDAEFESASVAIRYVLRDADGSPIGRLHITADPVTVPPNDESAYRLTLCARMQPSGIEIENILNDLDRGREEIVRMFAAVTTPEMHKHWRRK